MKKVSNYFLVSVVLVVAFEEIFYPWCWLKSKNTGLVGFL